MQFVERIGNFKISLLQIKSSNVSWLCYLNPINISACEETQYEIDKENSIENEICIIKTLVFHFERIPQRNHNRKVDHRDPNDASSQFI